MLGFIKKWNDRRKWEGSILAQAIAQHTQKFFGGGTMLSGLPQEQKNRLISRFYGEVATTRQSPNGFLDLRKLLSEWVAHYARFQVLCLTEEEKAAAFYRENPFISGELHRQVRAVAAKNDELGRLLWDDPKISDDDLVGFANGECAKALYFANGLNMVRLESGDKTERDWFTPFVEALLVYEGRQRQIIAWSPGATSKEQGWGNIFRILQSGRRWRAGSILFMVSGVPRLLFVVPR